MIGLIWNCRGMSKKGMITLVKDLINDHGFVGLQETMKKNYAYVFFFFNLMDPKKKWRNVVRGQHG